MTTEGKPTAFDGWATLPNGVPPARVALIGVSGYARVHLDLLLEARERGAIQLVAAAIINPTQEEAVVTRLRALGCEVFADFRVMLAVHRGKIDLCCIPTGIAWHAPMTLAALEAGANVLLEKPLAGSMADVGMVRAAEHAASRFVAVGFQDIYSPTTSWFKQQLLDGAIGRLRSVRFTGEWPRATTYYTRNDWAGRLYAHGTAVFDSPLNNAFAHFVHLGLWLAGPEFHVAASPVSVAAQLWRSHDIESCDTALVHAQLSTDIELICAATHSSRDLIDPEIVIEADGGQAHWRYQHDCTLTPTGRATAVQPLPTAMENRRYMFASVLRRLHDPATLICDTASAEQHSRLIAAMHANAQIQTVPPDQIVWMQRPGDTAPVPTIRDLEEMLLAGRRRSGPAPSY